MPQIDLANTKIYIRDRGSNFIEVKIGEGNLQYSENKSIEFVLGRGELDTVRENNEQPLDVNFDFIWEYISSTTGATIEDALKRKGAASTWVSASTDPDAPYCVHLEIVHMPGGGTCTNPDEDIVEHIFLNEFHYEQLGHSLKDGTIDCRGKCNATQATTLRTES